MTIDPAPDHVVIGLYADGAMLPFVLSNLSMALHLLEGEYFTFELKTAVLERGLLVPAELHALMHAGQELQQAASKQLTEAPGDEAPEPDLLGEIPDEGEELGATEGDHLMWRLTLPDVLTIATAADFAASAYLTSFGEEAKAVQVEHNGMSAEVYDARIHETLGYLGRFQQEWQELFGEYPAYQQHLATLAALREEFIA
jgi:hypothetical protein